MAKLLLSRGWYNRKVIFGPSWQIVEPCGRRHGHTAIGSSKRNYVDRIPGTQTESKLNLNNQIIRQEIQVLNQGKTYKCSLRTQSLTSWLTPMIGVSIWQALTILDGPSWSIRPNRAVHHQCQVEFHWSLIPTTYASFPVLLGLHPISWFRPLHILADILGTTNENISSFAASPDSLHSRLHIWSSWESRIKEPTIYLSKQMPCFRLILD